METVALAVFSRAPVPGAAKRRLIPALGADGAAALQARMTEHVVAAGAAAAIGPVTIWGHPHPDHALFVDLQRRYGIHRVGQVGGDLGEKMFRAIDASLAEHRHVILVGSDCPSIDETVLRASASALQDHDAVLGAARDGGYVFIGMNRAEWSLFDGPRWGTDQVLEQTRARFARLGWRHLEFGPFNDIDRPEDLVHLPARFRDEL